jgi:hypothetical protein
MNKLLVGCILITLIFSSCALPVKKVDLTQNEKSVINKIAIKHMDDPRVQELLDAVKEYQRAANNEREKCHIKVQSLLKELLEVDYDKQSN